jgi:hypothetical protein
MNDALPVSRHEIFEKSVDNNKNPAKVASMTREEYKEKRRQARIQKDDLGARIGNAINGGTNYDNSSVWKIQQQVAKEIEPQIRANQKAWANQPAYVRPV